MEDDITYTSKANRNTNQVKTGGLFANSKKESKPAAASIPNSFLRKVHFMEKYPQSLRDYIKKCFAQCTDDKSRDIISTKLIDTINSVSGQGNINQHNWSTHPLVTPVEKEPTPPPPPPKETFNQYQNRPVQAFSSSFLNQQQSQPMLQRQTSYGYQQSIQQPYGNYPYGQAPPPQPQLIPPPPPPSLLQINMNQQNQKIQNNYYFQNQSRATAQNSYQGYEFNLQNNQYGNNYSNTNGNNQLQYNNNQNQQLSFQNKQKNNNFNGFNSNFNGYSSQKNQEFASYAPGQMIPKDPQTQDSQPSQFNSIQSKMTSNNIKGQQNSNSEQSSFGSNQSEFPSKGKKKKKNKKNKFNQQNQQNNNDDSNTPTTSSSISSSRQRISQLKSENTRAIVGTSTSLEKQYLRLAGDQDLDPTMIRPLPVLKESLKFCLDKFEKIGDYEYISEQLRSIRQDLTVQHIEDPFFVTVYETHAKLAIQYNDWGNFNQSMGPLENLYNKKLGTFDHICEFYMYRLIYLVGVEDIDGLYSFIPRIDHNVLISKEVQFAFKVWKIASSEEWIKYFSIMKKSNPLIASVMSLKAQTLRRNALSSTCCAFRYLSLQDYKTILCFDDDEDDLLRKFLDEYDVVIPEK